MTFKVGFCAGHGYNTAGKRTPDGEREWTFNDKVANAFVKELAKYEGVELKRFDDPTGKTDVPLATRTSKANAWGADIYISFHHNANTGNWGTWTGIETYPGSSEKSQQLGKLVHEAMVKSYGLKDRGIKSKNLYITRETKMPAVLLEGGYMDSSIDIKVLRNDSILAKGGKNVASAVAKYAGLKKKTVAKPVPKPQEKPKASVIHTVGKGETLWGISRKYDMRVDEIKSINGLISDVLFVGQELVIKGSVKVEAPKPKPKVVKPVVKPVVKAVVPYPGKPLKVGSEGKDVERVQRAVGTDPDGKFGNGTKAKVISYQKKHGLTADGIVGEVTWNKMF